MGGGMESETNDMQQQLQQRQLQRPQQQQQIHQGASDLESEGELVDMPPSTTSAEGQARPTPTPTAAVTAEAVAEPAVAQRSAQAPTEQPQPAQEDAKQPESEPQLEQPPAWSGPLADAAAPADQPQPQQEQRPRLCRSVARLLARLETSGERQLRGRLTKLVAISIFMVIAAVVLSVVLTGGSHSGSRGWRHHRGLPHHAHHSAHHRHHHRHHSSWFPDHQQQSQLATLADLKPLSRHMNRLEHLVQTLRQENEELRHIVHAQRASGNSGEVAQLRQQLHRLSAALQENLPALNNRLRLVENAAQLQLSQQKSQPATVSLPAPVRQALQTAIPELREQVQHLQAGLRSVGTVRQELDQLRSQVREELRALRPEHRDATVSAVAEDNLQKLQVALQNARAYGNLIRRLESRLEALEKDQSRLLVDVHKLSNQKKPKTAEEVPTEHPERPSQQQDELEQLLDHFRGSLGELQEQLSGFVKMTGEHLRDLSGRVERKDGKLGQLGETVGNLEDAVRKAMRWGKKHAKKNKLW